MARGFPKKAQIVEDFQAIKVSGSPVFTDLDAASIITWLDVFVKPVLERKKKSDPRYARYSIHNGKVMLLTQSGQTLQEEE